MRRSLPMACLRATDYERDPREDFPILAGTSRGMADFQSLVSNLVLPSAMRPAERSLQSPQKERGGSVQAPAFRSYKTSFVLLRGLESLSASLMSAPACLVADFSFVLALAFGESAWIDLPKLILLVPVLEGQVVPVISALKQATGTFRLWLTWIAATRN